MKASQLARIEAIKLAAAAVQLPYLTVSDNCSWPMRKEGADSLRNLARTMQGLADEYAEEEKKEVSA